MMLSGRKLVSADGEENGEDKPYVAANTTLPAASIKPTNFSTVSYDWMFEKQDFNQVVKAYSQLKSQRKNFNLEPNTEENSQNSE